MMSISRDGRLPHPEPGCQRPLRELVVDPVANHGVADRARQRQALPPGPHLRIGVELRDEYVGS
jgi:hypothetical protein